MRFYKQMLQKQIKTSLGNFAYVGSNHENRRSHQKKSSNFVYN